MASSVTSTQRRPRSCDPKVTMGTAVGVGCALAAKAACTTAVSGEAFLPVFQAATSSAAAEVTALRPTRLSGSATQASPSQHAALAAAATAVLAHSCGRRRSRASLSAVADLSTRSTQLPKVDRSSTKSFRRDLVRSEQYFKFGKSQMASAMDKLMTISGSELITKMRENGFKLQVGDVTFVLAESYGFCWGVERAVAMAYEARNYFPDKNVWVTNELIHNPVVNQNMTDMGFSFIKKTAEGGKDFEDVQKGDVVILPAFGATVDEMAFLKEREVQIVDTTCPWVSKVWNSVEKSKDKGHTAIIHGKYDHEETVATKSFAEKFIVVKNMDEAEYVANYVLNGGDREEFLKKFVKAVPEGFDPDTDLERVGVANQTTMLKGETELIGKLFERVMIRKYGPQNIDSHFVSFNTICDATQERQDAMYKMFGAEYEAPASALYADLEGEQVGLELKTEKNQEKLSSKEMEDATRGAAAAEKVDLSKVDFCLVIGGYNSSNTTHLLEIAEDKKVPAYHIDGAHRIGGLDPENLLNVIEHKPMSTSPADAMLDQGLEVTKNFIPDGPVVVGVTSGASTPDSEVGDCLQRLLAVRGLKA
mmetsp:Transcript_46921/g.101971  ORF Transcript_46921/g.101971 Transcript_46921/m.101971 type:complete len:592 (+) Transcript_46921:80-1855(+)|eukprot:CAMPEP_0170609678 /NCGR_PEP_ID=MMETSP0224-20130122/22252_1 /TAXON_ID=285029 /ORGANISM="Togula jolla, Strain CCCM 725" /LENGTH=591 /DNA_ID=CAMNT_0010934999 /DNA_START=80 /DNA_END=1855 /DNA_ORIENTATION=+